MNYVLFLCCIALLGSMSYLMKRIPEWVFELVASKSSFRSELSRITFEHQVIKAADIIGESEATGLMLEMAEIAVPILSKQERHLRGAIGRTIQKNMNGLTDEDVIRRLNDTLMQTEEVILQYRELGKDLPRAATLAKTNPTEAQTLLIRLFALKEQFEESRAQYYNIIGATYTAMQPPTPAESAPHHA